MSWALLLRRRCPLTFAPRHARILAAEARLPGAHQFLMFLTKREHAVGKALQIARLRGFEVGSELDRHLTHGHELRRLFAKVLAELHDFGVELAVRIDLVHEADSQGA